MKYFVTSLASLCRLNSLPLTPAPRPPPASSSSSSGGEGMRLRWLCTLPGAKAKQDDWFCQESQTIRAKRNLGVHLAPPPYANSCKNRGSERDGDLLSVTAEPE